MSLTTREDGYVLATLLCKPYGAPFRRWLSSTSAQMHIMDCALSMGIPADQLVDIRRGGFTGLAGSWIHPCLVDHLKAWLEPTKVAAAEPTKEDTSFTTLVLNGVTIQARLSDGYVNATQLCKAGGKLFANWFKTESTRAYLVHLSTDLTIGISELLDVRKGGSAQGSWIHPDLAIDLAASISPEFRLKVVRWTRELLATGSASSSCVKTNQELVALQQELMAERGRREQAEQEVVKAKERELKLSEFVQTTARVEMNEIIYIGTTAVYQRQHRFKVGGVASERHLAGRFCSYNTGRPVSDAFFCIRFWKVDSYLSLERRIKTLLIGFKDNRNKTGEDYHINGHSLIRAIDFIVTHMEQEVEWVNAQLAQFTEDTIMGEPCVLDPIEFKKPAEEDDMDIDITETDLQDVLQTAQARCERAGSRICWADISLVIKERHRRPRLTEWKDKLRTYLARMNIRIRGLRW